MTRVPFRPGVVAASASRVEEIVEAVVKEVRQPWRRRLARVFGARSRFRRDPENGGRLSALGIHVPRCLAASIRGRGGRDFLVTEFLHGCVSLRTRLWAGPGRVQDREELVRLLRVVGRWMRGVHDRGIWQRDMKPDNLLLGPGLAEARPGRAGPESAATSTGGEPRVYGGAALAGEAGGSEGSAFSLVDFTDVRFFPGGLSIRRRVRNLGQILDLPAAFDSIARVPLLEAYLVTARGELSRWESLVDADIRARRAHRRSVCGHDHVDEEARDEGRPPLD